MSVDVLVLAEAPNPNPIYVAVKMYGPNGCDGDDIKVLAEVASLMKHPEVCPMLDALGLSVMELKQ